MATTPQQLFIRAQQADQKGDLNQAWLAYQAVLKVAPKHAPSLLAMANILYRQKAYKRAIEIYNHLLESQPLNVDIRYRCGMAYAKLGEDKAIPYFKKVLKIHPASETKIRSIVQLQLAKALKRAGKKEEAQKIGELLIQHNPKNASALSLLGELAQQQKEIAQAYQYFLKVTELIPTNAAAFLNLGTSCLVLNKVEEAISNLEQALKLRPNWVKVYRELAQCYQHKGQAKLAVEYLQKAIQLAPSDKENYQRLTAFYNNQGDYKKSIKYGKEHLEIDPNNSKVHYNLGLAFNHLGYAAGSLSYFKKAYQLDANAQSAYAIGNVNNSLKDIKEAKHWFEQALVHDSDYYAAIYNLLFQKMDVCDWSNRKADEARLIGTLTKHLETDQFNQSIPSLYFNYFDLPLTLHLKMNKYVDKGNKKSIELLKRQVNFVHNKKQKKVLNIGYISPDFRDHPVGRLVANLFQYHDRTKVKIFTYFLTPYDAQDSYAKQIAADSDVYRDFSFADTVSAAQQIYADEIDILIDLAGHTANHRMPILALQPAPIQAHLIGYPDTTGADSFQYYLGDIYLTPNYLQPYYTEKIWHLPTAFLGAKMDLPDIETTKTQMDLPEDAFVFVGFNRAAKIEPELFQCWMNILAAVSNSVLWLSDFPEVAKNNLVHFAERQGIESSRLIFSIKHPYPIYLKSHQLGDLFLDTWHYSAGSTAIAALSEGLPMLTCKADNNASRMGACIVAAASLPELICDDLDEYQRKAIMLAKNPVLLKSYKERLIREGATVPLFNNQQFVKHLEVAFLEMSA